MAILGIINQDPDRFIDLNRQSFGLNYELLISEKCDMFSTNSVVKAIQIMIAFESDLVIVEMPDLSEVVSRHTEIIYKNLSKYQILTAFVTPANTSEADAARFIAETDAKFIINENPLGNDFYELILLGCVDPESEDDISCFDRDSDDKIISAEYLFDD